jgi:hypothetical protein
MFYERSTATQLLRIEHTYTHIHTQALSAATDTAAHKLLRSEGAATLQGLSLLRQLEHNGQLLLLVLTYRVSLAYSSGQSCSVLAATRLSDLCSGSEISVHLRPCFATAGRPVVRNYLALARGCSGTTSGSGSGGTALLLRLHGSLHKLVVGHYQAEGLVGLQAQQAQCYQLEGAGGHKDPL